MEITKLDELTAEITTAQPDKVETITLDQLEWQKRIATEQIQAMTLHLLEIESKITSVKGLGIKTRAEVKPLQEEAVVK